MSCARARPPKTCHFVRRSLPGCAIYPPRPSPLAINPQPNRNPSYPSALQWAWERGFLSELHPYANVEAEIAAQRHDPAGFNLWVLQVVPDKRNIEIQVPFDLEFQRGDRVM